MFFLNQKIHLNKSHKAASINKILSQKQRNVSNNLYYFCNLRYSSAALTIPHQQSTSFLCLLYTKTEVVATDSNKEPRAGKSGSLNNPELSFSDAHCAKDDTGLVIKPNHPWQGGTVYFCGVLSSQIISLLGFLFLLILGENESEIFPVQEEEKKEKNNLLIFSLVYWNWWWPMAPNKKLNSRFSTYSSSERSDATL